MPTPTVSIHVPMFETNAPAQSSAKRRCRNGANERERSTVADGTRLLHERFRAGRRTGRARGARARTSPSQSYAAIWSRLRRPVSARTNSNRRCATSRPARRCRTCRTRRRGCTTHARRARRGRAARPSDRPRKPKLSTTASESRAPGVPNAPRMSCSWVVASDRSWPAARPNWPAISSTTGPCSFHSASSSSRAAVAPGARPARGPRVGADAVEVARTRCRR